MDWFIRACLADHPDASAVQIARLWGECTGGDPLPGQRTRREVARLKGQPPARRRIRYRGLPEWMARVQAAVKVEGLREARARRVGDPHTGRSAWEIIRECRPLEPEMSFFLGH